MNIILVKEIFAFQKLICRTSWLMSSYAGFIPRRALRLKFKGKKGMGRPRRRWLSQLLEDEEREELARNRKVKTEDFSIIDSYKMETVL
jgi:hypothetical protein